jgi:hypothetical protein
MNRIGLVMAHCLFNLLVEQYFEGEQNGYESLVRKVYRSTENPVYLFEHEKVHSALKKMARKRALKVL